MITFLDGTGDFTFSTQLIDPDGNNTLAATQSGPAPKRNESDALNIVLVARPFVLKIGKYTVIVTLDDKAYEFNFEAIRGELQVV